MRHALLPTGLRPNISSFRYLILKPYFPRYRTRVRFLWASTVPSLLETIARDPTMCCRRRARHDFRHRLGYMIFRSDRASSRSVVQVRKPWAELLENWP